MGFQSSVSLKQGFGIVGDIYTDGPLRVQSLALNSTDAANNIVGRAFTLVSEGYAQAGGSGAFVGIMVNSKSQANYGTSGNTLAPSLAVANARQAEFLKMGEVVVYLNSAADIGDAVAYDDDTGELYAGAPATGQTAVPNAKVVRYATAAAGLAVIELTN